jgi:hypothetical protein
VLRMFGTVDDCRAAFTDHFLQRVTGER